MINVASLNFAYRESGFSLSIPSLEVADGQRLAFIGPSGSGKTTLLNLLAGVFLPDSGEISIEDTLINALTDAKRRDFRITRIGFIFQDFELLDFLSVLDNILHLYRISPALNLTPEVRRRAHELAEQMGIDDKLQRHVEDLSQGEKQRASICRALLPQPKVILADEATGNLDPDNKQRILDLLFDAVGQHQATLLAVTHDHELLPRFDRVVNFDDFRNRSDR